MLALVLLVNIHPYTSASDLLGFNFSLINVKINVNLTVKQTNSKCTQNTNTNCIASVMVQLKTPEQLGLECASHSDMFCKSYTSTLYITRSFCLPSLQVSSQHSTWSSLTSKVDHSGFCGRKGYLSHYNQGGTSGFGTWPPPSFNVHNTTRSRTHYPWTIINHHGYISI